MESSKISIVIVSGTRERLQMAAMFASVGAVSGNDVTVFLSMNSLAYFVKGSDETPPAEGSFGRLMEGKRIPGFRTLIEQAVELGDAKVFPCSMAMDVLEIASDMLPPYFGSPLGLTKFLHDAKGTQVFTF